MWKIKRVFNIVHKKRTKQSVLKNYLKNRLTNNDYDCVWQKQLYQIIVGAIENNPNIINNLQYIHRLDALNDLMQYLNMQQSEQTFFNLYTQK